MYVLIKEKCIIFNQFRAKGMRQVFPKKIPTKVALKKTLVKGISQKKVVRAKDLDLEMWYAGENVWVARFGERSFKKIAQQLVCYFNSVKIQVLSIKLFSRYGWVKTEPFKPFNPNINVLLQCLHIICRYKGNLLRKANYNSPCIVHGYSLFRQEPHQVLQMNKSTSCFECHLDCCLFLFRECVHYHRFAWAKLATPAGNTFGRGLLFTWDFKE